MHSQHDVQRVYSKDEHQISFFSLSAAFPLYSPPSPISNRSPSPEEEESG